MDITASQIKELKEKTGAGLIDCKKVLGECEGNMEKSVEILRKKGLSKADKKAGRAAKEGITVYRVDGKKGLVLKVNCETDFVAKTADFKNFVNEIADIIFTGEFEPGGQLPDNIEMLRKNTVAKLGENIIVSEWKFLKAKNEIYPYVHSDRLTEGKIAVIADIEINRKDEESKQLMKNIAMQITAMNPIAVDRSTISQSQLEEMKSIFTDEAKSTGKPEKVVENIVKGKLEKFFSESILMEQPYILDEEKKVKQVLEEFIKSKDLKIKVNSFIRVSL